MLLTFWERYRRILIAAAILFFLFMSYLLYHDSVPDLAPGGPLTPAYASESDQKLDAEQERAAAPQMKLSPRVFIDVKGSVKKPGLYSFEQGARIADAVGKAGGALPEADLTSINLAQPLLDGSMLLIPKKGASTLSNPCNKPISTIQSISPNSGGSNNSNNHVAVIAEKVNLNTATIQELMTLPGIGESRAKEIINFREKNGSFQTTDQLKKISGIGDKTYEKLKNKITI